MVALYETCRSSGKIRARWRRVAAESCGDGQVSCIKRTVNADVIPTDDRTPDILKRVLAPIDGARRNGSIKKPPRIRSKKKKKICTDETADILFSETQTKVKLTSIPRSLPWGYKE